MGKRDVRWQIWERMEREDLIRFPRPCYHRIPNFKGAYRAARRLGELRSFQEARCVFSAPDASLREARELVLQRGKVLAVALPHMRGYRQIEEREKIHQLWSMIVRWWTISQPSSMNMTSEWTTW